MRDCRLLLFVILTIASIILTLEVSGTRTRKCKSNRRELYEDELEGSTVDILKRRGYKAKEYYVRVQDNKYMLSLIRVTNPLINKGEAGLPNKDPLLFVHGSGGNANAFILVNDRVRPKNYSLLNINTMNHYELLRLSEKDQGFHSLVFTSLNFGHEVWLLNRRSTYESMIAFARNSDFPIEYWDFSFDEQAKYDLPATINFVLSYTKKEKLTIVGHSTGCTLILMTLAENPELANKISKALYWGPVFDVKRLAGPLVDGPFMGSAPTLSQRLGYFPFPKFTGDMAKSFFERTCSSFFKEACYFSLNVYFGEGSSRCSVEYIKPSNNWFHYCSNYEMCQLIQSMAEGAMHYYNYYDEERNLQKYKQTKPPAYDVSRIKLNTMSFWFGNTDSLGSFEYFKETRNRLTVPIQVIHIDDGGKPFNHLGFLLHKQANNLLIIPSMKVVDDIKGGDQPVERDT